MTDWGLFVQNLFAAGVARAAPIYFAAQGELLTERAGILNLGLEGIMLASAATGAWTSFHADSAWAGLGAAMLTGALLSLLHAFLCVSCRADQVVAGLSLVFLGTGLSSIVGSPLVELGGSIPRFEPAPIPWLSDLVVLGPILFSHNLLVYAVMVLPVFAWFHLFRTRAGLQLRAVGEDIETARAMGLPATAIRYGYCAVGGALGGLGGAALSLAITPGFVEGMTAGQGWIALGLVIFARWHPIYLAFGALAFGMIRRLPLDLQGTHVEAFQNPDLGFFLNMLPYLVAILVLTLGSIASRRGTGAPAGLGRSEDA